MVRRKSVQEIYKDYIFDIEQLKFQKLQEIKEKLYLSRIGKLNDDENNTTQFAIETQNIQYIDLEKINKKQ